MSCVRHDAAHFKAGCSPLQGSDINPGQPALKTVSFPAQWVHDILHSLVSVAAGRQAVSLKQAREGKVWQGNWLGDTGR